MKYGQAYKKLKAAKMDALSGNTNIKVGRLELNKSLELLQKASVAEKDGRKEILFLSQEQILILSAQLSYICKELDATIKENTECVDSAEQRDQLLRIKEIVLEPLWDRR